MHHDALAPVSGLSSLLHLDLSDNPLSSHPRHRELASSWLHPGLASLYCRAPGTWDAATNYSECLLDIQDYTDRGSVPIIVAYTYFVLSVVSLIFLIICLYIFCSFRSICN